MHHQSPPETLAPDSGAAWRTCLRQVTFVDPDATDRSDLILDEQAYVLLLEVLCGLRSPMLGETEVMGQFKAFLAGLPESGAWIRRLGQRLLADAGDIREQHLRHLGARTYGSAVRRRVRHVARVATIGTGQLASEILPFLTKAGFDLDQWGRSGTPRLPLAHGVTYRSLATVSAPTEILSLDPAAVVVAAPAPSGVVEAVLRHYADLRIVVDLRGEPDRPIHVPHVPVETLAAIFAELELARDAADRRSDAARAEIVRRSRQFASAQHLRPFGWEDLCA